MSAGNPYGIEIRKLRIYWDRPRQVWWGSRLLWEGRYRKW